MKKKSFPKRVRLLKASEFERVFDARNTASDQWVVLHGASNQLGYPRLGLTVSRQRGGAVERNRWKRLLREAFRMSQHSLPAIDLVCVVRAKVPPRLDQLMESLPALCVRIQKRIERASSCCEGNPS
jgi:ribonuclease P protein component